MRVLVIFEHDISLSDSFWYLVAHTLTPVPLHVKGYCEMILKLRGSRGLLGLHPVLYLLMYSDFSLNIRILVYEFLSYCDINILRIRSKGLKAVLWIFFIIFILSDILVLYSIGNWFIRVISIKWLSAHLTDLMFEEQLVNHLTLCSCVSYLQVT